MCNGWTVSLFPGKQVTVSHMEEILLLEESFLLFLKESLLLSLGESLLLSLEESFLLYFLINTRLDLVLTFFSLSDFCSSWSSFLPLLFLGLFHHVFHSSCAPPLWDFEWLQVLELTVLSYKKSRRNYLSIKRPRLSDIESRQLLS